MLTKFEEAVTLAVLKLKDEAYGISIYKHITAITGKELSLSSVYFPLERLVKKGLLESIQGEPTPKRGGMGRRFYRITTEGKKHLAESKRINEALWQGINGVLEEPAES